MGAFMPTSDPSPAPITIRQFVFPADYPDVISLWEGAGPGVRVGRSDQPEEIIKKMRRDPDLFLVAEIANKIVGTVLGGFDGRRGMMYHLAVAADFRGRGIGTLLAEELEKQLRNKGCLRYYLLVIRDNHEAISFYESQGWKRMDYLYAYGKDLA
jgi:ribosomal protein S18 acetylase RimI-like enzyme